MTPLPVDVDQVEPKARLDLVRLRLLDAAADLRPLPTPEELEQRLSAVVSELADVLRELRLLQHVSAIEETGLEAELVELDEAIAGGWTPDAEPVDAVVERLRAQFHLS